MLQLIKNLLANTRLWQIAFFLFLGFVYYTTLSPIDNLSPGFLKWEFTLEGVDKYFHFLAFFGLSFLMYPAFPKTRVGLIIFILFLVGGSIEILQHLLPINREMDVKDVFANVFGSIVGVYFIKYVYAKLLAKA